jgi:hypothetical protein
MELLVHRITIIEFRTILPFFLCTILIPFAFFAVRGLKAFGLLISILGVVASFVTLTRSHVLSALVGLISLLALVGAGWAIKGWHSSMRAFAGAIAVSAAGLAIVWFTPVFNRIPDVLELRTKIEQPMIDASKIDFGELRRVVIKRAGKISAEAAFNGMTDQTGYQFNIIASRLAYDLGYDKAQSIFAEYQQMAAQSAQADASSKNADVATKTSEKKPGSLSRPQTSTAQTRSEPPTSMPDGRSAAPPTKAELEAAVMKAVVEANSGQQLAAGSRLHDEWGPALMQYWHNGLLEKVIGMGAGKPFKTAAGEERTYIHNFPLYVLLYQGIIGIVIWLVLNGTIAWRLFNTFIHSGSIRCAAVLSLFVSLQVLALLFAVHKLLSFNILIVVIYIIAWEGFRSRLSGDPSVS